MAHTHMAQLMGTADQKDEYLIRNEFLFRPIFIFVYGYIKHEIIQIENKELFFFLKKSHNRFRVLLTTTMVLLI